MASALPEVQRYSQRKLSFYLLLTRISHEPERYRNKAFQSEDVVFYFEGWITQFLCRSGSPLVKNIKCHFYLHYYSLQFRTWVKLMYSLLISYYFSILFDVLHEKFGLNPRASIIFLINVSLPTAMLCVQLYLFFAWYSHSIHLRRSLGNFRRNSLLWHRWVIYPVEFLPNEM